MNCAQCRELLVAYLDGLLDEPQKQTVEAHLKACETCRTDLQGLQTLQQRLVDSGKALAQSDLEDQVMNRILREQSARLKSAAQAGMGLALRRLIVRSSVIKTGVAAAVVLAAVGGIFLWSGTRSGVALADVLARVEQVQAFMYQMTMHMKGQMEGANLSNTDMSGSILIADGYGMRMDMSMTDAATGQVTQQQMYMQPEQKKLMMVLPQMKKYMRMEFDESMVEKMREQNKDPRLMIKQVLVCRYQDLGRSVIDGVNVQGFQTTDPAYAGNALGDVDVRIWVHAKTGLPVRMEMHIKANEQMEMDATLHDFQWDVPVSAAEFNPVLPADYTAAPGDGLKVPAMTEQTAVAGLQMCLDLLGRYPENLNVMTLMQMIQETKDSQTPRARKLREAMAQAKDDEERAKVVMESMMPLQMLGGFYGTLVQEKEEPAYYGKVVQPGDIAQVLLRWKTGENEYRVIFADLHAETVDADTLAKLEAALPN